MQFILNNKLVHPKNKKTIKPYCFLSSDSWDDFGYQTIFALTYVDMEQVEHEIGLLHVGRIGQRKGRVNLPTLFEKFEEDYFSLGVNVEFYKNLRKLDDPIREVLLESLRDVAYEPELLKKIQDERVFLTSFLRAKHLTEIEEQFHRVANGDAFNSNYDFKLVLDKKDEENTTLTFSVIPYSDPPTNVHAIIGRNGVGKSRLLQGIAELYISEGKSSQLSNYSLSNAECFNGLVAVAFSTFDKFLPISFGTKLPSKKYYVYVGFKYQHKNITKLLSPDELDVHFSDAAQSCAQPGKRDLWKTVISMLETDPLLRDYEFKNLVSEDNQARCEAIDHFKELSSGHKIVLLTMAKLVQNIAEQSLVLLDEPELHLHPPLLSSFMRALSHLMREQNGVAVIVTHSPVVLQEVPRSCTWILRRSAETVRGFRPSIETFGEGIGTLTHEVFELEAAKSGFYSFLESLVDEGMSRESILDRLSNQLGSEGRAVLAALLASRRKR